LSKDERQVRKIRKYTASPFPLLSCLDVFRYSHGDWNLELQDYGLQVRAKYPEPVNPTNYGSHIFLIHYDTVNLIGNRYLKRQYKRLTKYRDQGDPISYWSTSWHLMCHSWSFRLASLNSWMPRWYKELDLYSLKQLWSGLHKILSLTDLQTRLTNLWIESPKGKWRELCIPNKSWRLYLHMMNNFISYLYYPHLPTTDYDGFLYNRGALSWWTGVLWGPYLSTYNHLLEIDFSSAFSNINCRYLQQVLIKDGLIPQNIINLILTHLRSPCTESTFYPTFSSYVEHKHNSLWKQSSRNLPMGLGISPILFVISLHHAFQSLKLKSSDFCYRVYADDLSFYFNIKGLVNILTHHWKSWKWLIIQLIHLRNVLIELLNSSTTFKKAGLKICTKKSGLVKLFGIWLKPYVSLGLRLNTSLKLYEQLINQMLRIPIPLELSGWTRGRGGNPIKGKSPTSPSRHKLEYLNVNPNQEKLAFTNLLRYYKKYFGLFQAKMYSNGLNSQIVKPTTLKSLKKSPLRKLLHYMKMNPKLRKSLDLHINIYNAGGKLNEIYLETQSREGLSMKWQLLAPNLERELKIEWKTINTNPCYETIPDPLSKETYIELEHLDVFKKFSEIKLTPQELKQYEEEYSKVKRKP